MESNKTKVCKGFEANDAACSVSEGKTLAVFFFIFMCYYFTVLYTFLGPHNNTCKEKTLHSERHHRNMCEIPVVVKRDK